MAVAEIAFAPKDIRQRVSELAIEIRTQMAGERPVLVSVLQGSVIFFADLLRALEIDGDVDFLSVSSYPGQFKTGGVVRIIKDLEIVLQDRRVVLVEDVVDTGLTLAFLLRTLETRNPRSIHVCTLINKPLRRIAQPPVHYVGFESDRYLVGYGLDFQGLYRNLPYLAAVEDVPALAAEPRLLEPLFGAVEQV